MILFGVLNVVYQGTSLVPAYVGVRATAEGLRLQSLAEGDSRQGLAYVFLKECASGKVIVSLKLTRSILICGFPDATATSW